MKLIITLLGTLIVMAGLLHFIGEQMTVLTAVLGR